MTSGSRVITVAAQKGGTGKSTVAIHLAVEALRAHRSSEVVILDVDPQGSVSDWAMRRATEDPMVLRVQPGNLEGYVDQARRDGIAYIFIDTPPHADATIVSAARMADLVLLPIRPGPFDIKAAAKTVEIVRRVGRPGLFVLNQVPPTGSEGEDTVSVLAELFPDFRVAEARLGQRKAFMQALISGLAITEYDRQTSRAVGEIKALFREVSNRLHYRSASAP
jgi:chromosome partitioning protein